ncbi:MAG: hypothetical protein KJ630_12900 [Proteobacteria bacterium]|nr:hypothetical protein [Pseudomonadota bacterium]
MLPIQKEKISSRFKLFHELMLTKVQSILLIGTSYEAWIMEEDCRISEQIVNEYRGLNLSRPPRLTWVSSLGEALEHYPDLPFDLVITFSRAVDDNAFKLGREIKIAKPEIPVVLLTHQEALPESTPAWHEQPESLDLVVYWSGQADILLAIVKSIEDRYNAVPDAQTAGVRVILFVEDSPYYLALMLPILYKQLVIEVQSVIEDGLNEEHRLLSMRTRPKILIAHSYEKALALYEQFEPYILGVISDMRYHRNHVLDGCAGLQLLSHIKQDRFDIPLLLASSETHNAEYAKLIPALFLDKNAPSLQESIKTFLVEHLGYGDFVFRMPDGTPYDQASSLYSLEKKLETIPLESFLFHSRHNDFSRWFYTLAEVELASQVRPLRDSAYDTVEDHRHQLIGIIKEKRIARQRGIIVNFDRERYDPDTNFAKTGNGSLGGKARGLAFFSALLYRHRALLEPLDRFEIVVPQTLVLTTDAFDEFIRHNRLHNLTRDDVSDEEVTARFKGTPFPQRLSEQIGNYLQDVNYPLAIRSSSILEDAQFKSYAGLYHTCMLANDHPDFAFRLSQLENAIRRVYASTYFRAPKAFSKRVGNQIEQEKMAVILQEVVGSGYGGSYYPAISGVAQSLNYYPFARMKPEDGIVSIALGLGKSVMEGEKILRFSPRYPEILPQRSTLSDILKNAQQSFYALQIGRQDRSSEASDANTLERRQITEATNELPVQLLASTYDPAEQRIRDQFTPQGIPVLTFASILKHKAYPLPEAVATLLDMGQKGLGCPVEIEFAVDFPGVPGSRARLAVLQIRPMSAREEMLDVDISPGELDRAFCLCHQALGNTDNRTMCDLVYIRPDTFDPSHTPEMARQLGKINAGLMKTGKKYILVGPGRWGSADHWLGIPVNWGDICGVGAIVETVHPAINADPSQGSHFFHNITSLGINYLNVGINPADRFDWQKLAGIEVVEETAHTVHIRCPEPFVLRVDGRKRIGVVLQAVN